MSISYFGLDGKRALVTGASSGLGAHFARTLADAGAHVVLAARRVDRLESLASEITGAGGQAKAVEMDVGDRQSIQSALARICETSGVPEILVNNAGVGGRDHFLEVSAEKADHVFGINFRGVWDVGQAVAQKMVAEEINGSIVNISSIMGFGLRYGASAYCVSKAAVVQMTNTMACDLAPHNIRVNSIAPGYFATEMTTGFLESEVGQRMTSEIPMKRTGRLEELDGALLLLASERGSFMTGSTIVVDGGHLIAGM